MSVSGEIDGLVNHGCIVRPNSFSGEPCPDGATIILSGLGRSGTTMLASVCQATGLHIGTYLAEPVLEDREFADRLLRHDRNRLIELITARNAVHRMWGFKLPNLHWYLPARDIMLFRNPRLVLMMRDLAAVSVRTAIAEYTDTFQELTDLAHGLCGLIQFAASVTCPVMLVSYEKAIASPDRVIPALMRFCGLATATDAKVHAAILPNNPDYRQRARRQFDGRVERLDAEGVLHGWARELGVLSPTRVDIMLDGRVAATTVANVFRPDIKEWGHGEGYHGFNVYLGALALTPATCVVVRAHGLLFEFDGSRRTVADLCAPQGGALVLA